MSDKSNVKIDNSDVMSDKSNVMSDKSDVKIDKLDVKIDKLDVKIDKPDVKIDKLDVKIDKRDVKIDKRDVKIDKRDVKIDKRDVKSDKPDVKSDKPDVAAPPQKSEEHIQSNSYFNAGEPPLAYLLPGSYINEGEQLLAESAACDICCRLSPDEIVMPCSCSRMCKICPECAKKWDTRKCKHNVELKHNMFHSDWRKLRTLNKPYSNTLGKCPCCEWTGRLSGYHSHYVNNCPNAIGSCPNGSCKSDKYIRADAAKHYAVCKYVCIPCHQCTVTVRRDLMDIHLIECPESVWVCAECDCKEVFKNKNAHISTCPNQLITCPFAKMGCTDKIMRCNIAQHKKEKLEHHMELVEKMGLGHVVNTPVTKPVTVSGAIGTIDLPPESHSTRVYVNDNVTFKLTINYQSSTIEILLLTPGFVTVTGQFVLTQYVISDDDDDDDDNDNKNNNYKHYINYKNHIFGNNIADVIANENIKKFSAGLWKAIDFKYDIIYAPSNN